MPVPTDPPPVLDDPWAFYSAEAIAEAARVPLEAVLETWPHVVAQLTLCGINRPKVQIGVIGTMAHETASAFRPVKEGFYLGEPEPAETHRRGLPYYPYYGTGDVQLTHLSNYVRYTAKLAELWGPGAPDLAAEPEAALDQDVAGAVIALWFRDERALPTPAWPAGYSLQDACDAEDDEWIRRLVYGGADAVGMARIARVRAMLAGGAEPRALTYAPNTPPERQIQNWVCAIRAGAWALKSMGVETDAGRLQDEMVPGTVTPREGLLDGRGYGLAAILGRHVPAGTRIEVLEGVTWAELLARAGRGPICLGSGAPELYHWINVARVLEDGSLSAPNPAPNHPAGAPLGDVLTRHEFERYAGTWSAVFVEVVPLEVVPGPRPGGTPDPATLVGVAYHEDGVIIPALEAAVRSGDWGGVAAVVSFLRDNNPDRPG